MLQTIEIKAICLSRDQEREKLSTLKFWLEATLKVCSCIYQFQLYKLKKFLKSPKELVWPRYDVALFKYSLVKSVALTF